MENTKNLNRVYIGKVLKKEVQGKDGGTFEITTLLADNPLPVKKDGSPDPYHKGQLIYRTAEGNEFLVKQALFRGVSEKAAQNGFIKSVAIDLDDTYGVTKLS